MTTDAKPRRGTMHLNLFASTFGLHPAAWRRPESDVNDMFDAGYFARLAQTAERGLFDALFVADVQVPAIGPGVGAVSEFEPATLLSLIAGKTTHLGLVGTLSSTFYAPMTMARLIASVDLISGGRAGVNVVTSTLDAEARLYGSPAILPPIERYERAEEFVDLLIALWGSYPREAVIGDRVGGRLFDESVIRRIDHEGKHFRLEGMLDILASPQGRPVIVQAGASEEGRNLAARVAEMVFGPGQTLELAKAHREDVLRRARGFGRDTLPAVLPALNTLIADTEKEARELRAYLDSLDAVENKLERLGIDLGIDCTGWALDDLMPALPPAEEAGVRLNAVGRYEGARSASVEPDGSPSRVGDVLSRLGGGRGGFTLVGTPDRIADEMTRWFQAEACDGFNLSPMILPDGAEVFVDTVVPRLQERGVFRSRYRGTTLREHLREG